MPKKCPKNNTEVNPALQPVKVVVSLTFFRDRRKDKNKKRGCVFRSIFEVPSTHASVVMAKENKKKIGDFKT